MMNKLLMLLTALGLSVGSVQAEKLTFMGTHQAANDLELYYFQNLSDGDVDIWMDTLTDGMDADLNIWKKVAGSSVVGQPEDSDWELIEWMGAAERPFDRGEAEDVGATNNYGTALKNGFVANSPEVSGTSDPGSLLVNLAAGNYLMTVTGDANKANGQSAGDRMSLGFVGFDGFLGIEVFPHNYELYVDGNVANVSAVPVPAAVWLFGSAIVALGAVRRNKSRV